MSITEKFSKWSKVVQLYSFSCPTNLQIKTLTIDYLKMYLYKQDTRASNS